MRCELVCKMSMCKRSQAVFDLMSHRDFVSWNEVLTAYFTNKEYEKGLSTIFSDEQRWSHIR